MRAHHNATLCTHILFVKAKLVCLMPPQNSYSQSHYYSGTRSKNVLLSCLASTTLWKGKEIKDLVEIDLDDNPPKSSHYGDSDSRWFGFSSLFGNLRAKGRDVSTKADSSPESVTDYGASPYLIPYPKQDLGSMEEIDTSGNCNEQQSFHNNNLQFYPIMNRPIAAHMKNEHLSDQPAPTLFEPVKQIFTKTTLEGTFDEPCEGSLLSLSVSPRRASKSLRADAINAPPNALLKFSMETSKEIEKSQEQRINQTHIKRRLERLFEDSLILKNKGLRSSIDNNNGGITLTALLKDSRLGQLCQGNASVLEDSIRNSCGHFLELLIEDKVYVRPKDWVTILAKIN